MGLKSRKDKKSLSKEIKLKKRSFKLYKRNKQEGDLAYIYFFMSSSGSIPPCLPSNGTLEKNGRAPWRGRGNLQPFD